MYVLDTDILSLVRHGHELVCRHVIAIPANEVSITVVTVEESLTGWYTEIRRAKNDEAVIRAYASLQQAVENLREIRILPFDAGAAAIVQKLRSQDRRAGTNDIRIAAIALNQNGILLTRNTKDFSRFSDLAIEDWTIA